MTQIQPPFQMHFASVPVRNILIHQKCGDSLLRILKDIWDQAGHKQEIIASWGLDVFGGSFNYRLMRGKNVLSMHAYGAAIDFDPERNPLGSRTVHMPQVVVTAFEKEGWVWGGHWKNRPDGMHFQAARVG